MAQSKDTHLSLVASSEIEPAQMRGTSGTQEQQERKKYPCTKNWSDEKRAAFLEENKPLIRSVVSRIQNIQDSSIGREDLFQEAQIAFWVAYDNYDPEMNTLFTTYAHKCMRNAINEKLRSSIASKRRPQKAVIPYDSGESEYGDDIMGGDNMEIESSLGAAQPLPVEDQCSQNEVLGYVYKLLQTLFTKEEQHIFLALAQKNATQLELAKEMGCSQAKISMMYKFVRVRLQYELKKAGFSDPSVD